MDKFSKEEIELLVFYEIITPLNKHRRSVYWKFPEYTDNDIKGLKKVLKSIKHLILANQIEKEWQPVLTNRLSTSELDFSDDLIDIIHTAKYFAKNSK